MANKGGKVPLIIEDTEPLLRAISTPSCLDAEKRATHLAFRLRPDIKESDLSLSRRVYEELKDFLKRALRFKFTFLSLNDVPAGAVELIAGGVHGLDKHIILNATPTRKNPAHASIFYMKEDGSFYVAGQGKTTDPVDASILGYEMALASIVHKVYDKEGNILWEEKDGHEE